jgi:hypothetical protein
MRAVPVLQAMTKMHLISKESMHCWLPQPGSNPQSLCGLCGEFLSAFGRESGRNNGHKSHGELQLLTNVSRPSIRMREAEDCGYTRVNRGRSTRLRHCGFAGQLEAALH